MTKDQEKEYIRLRNAWYKKLKDEGFQDIENTDPNSMTVGGVVDDREVKSYHKKKVTYHFTPSPSNQGRDKSRLPGSKGYLNRYRNNPTGHLIRARAKKDPDVPEYYAMLRDWYWYVKRTTGFPSAEYEEAFWRYSDALPIHNMQFKTSARSTVYKYCLDQAKAAKAYLKEHGPIPYLPPSDEEAVPPVKA